MSDNDILNHLQQIAADFDYDHDALNPIGVILCAPQKAHPQASSEQLLIAIQRAQTELEVRITAVNGWCLDDDMTDSCRQKLERMKCHISLLEDAALNCGAVTPDLTEDTLAQLRARLGERMLILSPGDQVGPEVALAPSSATGSRTIVGYVGGAQN